MGADLSAVWVASAESQSDAVAAAAGAGRSGGVLLLASDGQGPGASESLALLSEGGTRVDSLVLVGGASALETTLESRLLRTVTEAPFHEFTLTLVVDEGQDSVGSQTATLEACHIGTGDYTQTFGTARYDFSIVEASLGRVVAETVFIVPAEVYEETWTAGECKTYEPHWDGNLGSLGSERNEPPSRAASGRYRFVVQWNGEEGLLGGPQSVSPAPVVSEPFDFVR